ncbi:hypothetical protein ABIA32_006327 [Streptacidiphilus sp. MAP12-20]
MQHLALQLAVAHSLIEDRRRAAERAALVRALRGPRRQRRRQQG